MSKSEERKVVKSLMTNLGLAAAHARKLYRTHGSYSMAVKAYRDSVALMDDVHDPSREGRRIAVTLPKTDNPTYANPRPVEIPERLQEKWDREEDSGSSEPSVDSKIGRRATLLVATILSLAGAGVITLIVLALS